MKVKLFTAITEIKLENKINSFLSDQTIEIVDIQYSSTLFSCSVLLTYKI